MNKTEPFLYEPPAYLQELAVLVYNKRQANGCGEGRFKRVQSLREAAREIGVAAATLSRIERGSLPDIETFRKICVWLGISADHILSLTASKTETSL